VKLVKIILPLLILLGAIGLSAFIIKTKPTPERKSKPEAEVVVEVLPLQSSDYPIQISAQGTVRPRTESTLVPEVSGKILTIAPQFRDGSFFEKGQTLLQIDPSNYEIAVTIARSKVAEMNILLAEEQAKAEQAQRNWQRLGQSGTPSDLVLRKPQLMSARAALASAEAQLQKAELDLKRTRIIAPYAGRILDQKVDIGQYVTPGTVLADIYAVDYAEIRLPLSDYELQYIDYPDLYRGQDPNDLTLPEVTLKASMGDQHYQWLGRIVRAEGAYDARNRRLALIAQVENPYGPNEHKRPPLKVGQFIEAQIQGKILNDVFVIPVTALRENDQIILVNSQSQLNLVAVNVLWRNEKEAVIKGDLSPGDWLCITPLQYVVNGMPLTPLYQNQPVFDSPRRGNKT
jgi:multidrug efflux system membrane fusion protein